jgi:hypothetical protein
VRLARLGLPLLLGVVIWTQIQIDARLGSFRAQEDVLYLWDGEHVKRLFPGFESLMADIYWLRTVQYFGGKFAFREELNFDLLEPLVDITTTLDPRFELAYRYGATFLAEPYPNGAGQAEAAVALLEKGVRNNPENWKLYWDLGYFRYLFLDDPLGGAQVLLEAAEIPGSATWLKNLAAALLTWKGNERALARALWSQILAEAEAEPIRRNAQDHLDYIEARDRMDVLDAAAAEFHRAVGRFPRSLAELEAAVAQPLPMEDPRGHRFVYDQESGRSTIARASALWRLLPLEEK